MAKTNSKTPTGYRLSNRTSGGPKLGVYGEPGTGKTMVLLGPLLAGERVAGVSTDMGGNGLDTIESALYELDRPDLLDNLYNVDLTNWDDIYGFVKEPYKYFPDLDDFDPTVMYTDGFSSAQIHSADEYVLSLDSGLKDGKSEMREKGVVTIQRDWDAIKRLTMRYLVRFISLRPETAKIITMLENSRAEESGAITTGPMIQGAARNMMNAAFDIFMRTSTKTEKSREEGKRVSTVKYFYTFRDDGGKVTVKVRGRSGVPDEAEADPVKLWKCLNDRKIKWEEA